MKKIESLIKHFGSRAELARRLKLNSAEVIRRWQLRGSIPDWRIDAVEKLHRRVIKT